MKKYKLTKEESKIVKDLKNNSTEDAYSFFRIRHNGEPGENYLEAFCENLAKTIRKMTK